MVHIIAIFLLFGVSTVMNIGKMHVKLVLHYYSSYTGSSPIAGLVSRYDVTQVKYDNGKGVYCQLISFYELCYKGTLLQRNYWKIKILWSFSYNSFVKCLI